MKESAIEQSAVRKAKQRGWSSRKNESRFSRGYPDRLFWKMGRYVWIEFKRPGNRPTELQTMTMERLMEEGCYVAWCSSVKSCMAILDAVDRMHVPNLGRDYTDYGKQHES